MFTAWPVLHICRQFLDWMSTWLPVISRVRVVVIGFLFPGDDLWWLGICRHVSYRLWWTFWSISFVVVVTYWSLRMLWRSNTCDVDRTLQQPTFLGTTPGIPSRSTFVRCTATVMVSHRRLHYTAVQSSCGAHVWCHGEFLGVVPRSWVSLSRTCIIINVGTLSALLG